MAQAVDDGVGTPVYANVYHLIPEEAGGVAKLGTAMDYAKVGLYHVGIEVLGSEWSFGDVPEAKHDPSIDGVFRIRPRTAPGGEFKEQVLLGRLNPPISELEARTIVQHLMPQWKACTYHLLKRNCIHFSRAFAGALSPQCEAAFPAYVSRAPGVASVLLPDAVLSSLTDALAPPVAAPEHLVGRLNVPWNAAVPAPGPERPQPQQAASPASSEASSPAAPSRPMSTLGGLTSWAKAVAATVTDTVQTNVAENQKRALFSAFPQFEASDVALRSVHAAHAVHLYKDRGVQLYVTDRCVAIAGDTDTALRVVLDHDAIYSIHYVRRIPAQVRGLPSTYELASDSQGGDDAGVVFFLRDGSAVPVFQFRAAAAKASNAWAKLMEGHSRNVRVAAVDTFLDECDAAWRGALRRKGIAIAVPLTVAVPAS